MHLGKNNNHRNDTLDKKTLNQTTSEKYLGVFVDPLLNFENHIDGSVKKARRISGLRMHTFNYKQTHKVTIINITRSTYHRIWQRCFVPLFE